jgi:protein-tyrosine sulfotransferase
MIDMRHAWSQAPKEAERLQNAGITDELIDSALSAFILEIIVNHGKVNKKSSIIRD